MILEKEGYGVVVATNGRDFGVWLEATKKLTTIVNMDEGICEKGADITFVLRDIQSEGMQRRG